MQCKKSDFARDALVIVARDNTLCEDYEYYDRLIDYLAERLVSELGTEHWKRTNAIELKKRKKIKTITRLFKKWLAAAESKEAVKNDDD